MIAMVKFNVGPQHPLYNKFVPAEIECGLGYDGRQIEGTTCAAVYFPEDPEGIACFDSNGVIVEYRTRPAYYKTVTTWVEMIQLHTGQIVSAREFAEYQEYLRLKAKFEGMGMA